MSESDDAGAIPLPLLTQTLACFVDPAARLISAFPPTSWLPKPVGSLAVAQQEGIHRFVAGTLSKETNSILKFYRSHGFTPWRIQFFK